ncbi:hypothetical protein Cfor_01902 [Coptotermes formosanus]|uniref:Transmembrane protein 234-like protein n=1 Tax=Coptotermes formosanus TaxID=36987 RepID=A0A6L2Q045_COPFO|nr:hypothetical protein Cfor_01902 [Coptotermes formosanus]
MASNESMLDAVCSLIAVGILWGATNPFIKKGSAGVENVKAAHSSLQLLCEYMLPFILNQFGSVLYFITLGTSDLTLAVPVANSLTFVATAVCGWAVGEETPNRSEREVSKDPRLHRLASLFWFCEKMSRQLPCTVTVFGTIR